jgi:hypothetical protein
MRNRGVVSGGQLQLAETLGLAMARRAAEILDRHRAALTAGVVDSGPGDAGPTGAAPSSGAGPRGASPASGSPSGGGAVAEVDDAEFDADNAIFTAVLDAANECIGVYDTRPADDRWCDALLQLIYLAQLSPGGATPRTPLLSPGGATPRTPYLE